METKIFTYSKVNQKKIAFRFLVLAVLGASLALYTWMWSNTLNLTILIGGIFLSILGIGAFIKLIFAPTKENQLALKISKDGIVATTSPVARGAGLIEWCDIEDLRLATGMLEVKTKNPGKYAERMNNFFIKDTFLKSLKGTIRISLVETNVDSDELRQVLSEYSHNS